MEHVKANGPKYLIQVIEGVRTGRTRYVHELSDSLNAISHNHHFLVDPDQAFSMWASIDSIAQRYDEAMSASAIRVSATPRISPLRYPGSKSALYSPFAR
ncbi:MAG: hypothetical protein R2703_09675 [Micropruina glycogenica]